MRLTAGLYKIKNTSYLGAYGLLQVYKRAGQHYFRINHGQEYDFERLTELDGYRVIKQLVSLEVKNVKVTISFEDGDGDTHEFNARTLFVVRDILKQFPQIARALGSTIFQKASNN